MLGGGRAPQATPQPHRNKPPRAERMPAWRTSRCKRKTVSRAKRWPERRRLPLARSLSRLDAEGKPQTEAAGQMLGDVKVESVPELGTVILRGSRPDVSRVAAQVAKYWALQGLRGLSIQIDQSDARQVGDGSDDRTQAALEFRSLGTDPELDITVYQQSRMTWLAWTVVLVILVAGLMQTHAPVRTRLRWVILFALLACGLPIIGGPLTEFSVVFEKALSAVLALIPLWIVIACVERFTGWIRRRGTRWASIATMTVLIVSLSAVTSLTSVAEAQDIRELLKPILDEDHPARIPDDAVVIPYDPADIERARERPRRCWFLTRGTWSCGTWRIRTRRLATSRRSSRFRAREPVMPWCWKKLSTWCSRARSTSSCSPTIRWMCRWHCSKA